MIIFFTGENTLQLAAEYASNLNVKEMVPFFDTAFRYLSRRTFILGRILTNA